MDSKKAVPFQRNQMSKIVEIVGMPCKERWPSLVSMPEYSQLQSLASTSAAQIARNGGKPPSLENWYHSTLKSGNYPSSPANATPGANGLSLLQALLEYDPSKRLTARQALEHPYFTQGEKATENCFEGLEMEYPHRRVSQDDNGIGTSSLPGTKRGGLPDDSLVGRPTKRFKEG